MTNQKLTILCDMDGILVDILQTWIYNINSDYGTDIIHSDITHYDITKSPKLSHIPPVEVYRYLQRPNLFLNARPVDGSLDGLKKLNDLGHKIYIASTPAGPISAKEKLEWLINNLPWLSHKNVFLGHAKYMIKGDILIDDHDDTLVNYSKEWPNAKCLGIKYEYNGLANTSEYNNIYLMPDYTNTKNAWDLIVNSISNSE